MINRMRLLLGRFRLVLHGEDSLSLSKKLLLFLRQLLYSYSSYDIYESTLDPPQVTREVDDLTIRIITSLEEVERLESDQVVDEGFDLVRDKEIVTKGTILFCAFVGQELAHITQVFMGRRANDIYPFCFARAYGHTVGLAAFTAQKYRRKGIHLWTRSKVLQYLREKKVSRAWDVQEKDNIAARDSLVKLGYYLWGEGCRLRLLSILTFEWTKPQSRVVFRRTYRLYR